MARRRTFSEWLQLQRHRDDSVADLAVDVATDAGAQGAVTAEDFLARCPMLPPHAARAARTATRRWQRQAQVLPEQLARAEQVIEMHDLMFGPPAEDPLDVPMPSLGTTTDPSEPRPPRATLRTIEGDLR